MKTTLVQRFLDYLQHTEIKNLLATGLIVIAAVAIASIGISSLANTLHNWFAVKTYIDLDTYGRAFNAMVADSVVSLIAILPSLPIILIAYMVSESHPTGNKLSMTLAIGLLAFAFLGNYKFEIILIAGILCALSGTIGFIIRKQKNSKIYLPIVTENIAKILAGLTGLIGVTVLFSIIVYVGLRGMPYVTWDFVTGKWIGFTDAANQLAKGNVAQMGGLSEFILGSLILVAFCELIALPLGFGSAIYLSEYSSENKLTNTIRFFIETLAGVPSIVYGLIGFVLFVRMASFGQSVVSAGLALAFMILPWNIRVTEEAMKAVPQSYREGSYALGATKWETIKTQVIYAASPGIITGILLGVGAAIGETAVLMWTAGGLEAIHLPTALISNGNASRIPTLAMWIYLCFTEFGQAPGPGWTKENVTLAGSFVLLMIFLAISLVALVARNYLSKKIRGH